MSPSPTEAREAAWYPQLDALRAFAMADTLLWHFGPASVLQRFPSLGSIGVNLFFVLSGFLITGILLRSKRLVERSDESRYWRTILGRFCARRFLRIFPLYYAVVLLLTVLRFDDTRHALPWNLAYLQLLSDPAQPVARSSSMRSGKAASSA